MNGAETLVKTFLAGGVDVCFANPGTSEMHFVAALDRHPDMRCVLCLFEGGATGAADGYYRMAGRPAATLLHLSPGFANGYANLHNARKGRAAVINVVGEHAEYHLRFDAPLKGDVAGVTGSVSDWVKVSMLSDAVAQDGAEAIRAATAKGGQIATLVLPANTAWETATGPVEPLPPVPLYRPRPEQVAAAAEALREEGAVLMIGGPALHGALARQAGRVAAATGARLMSDLFVPRIERGAGAVAIDSLTYPVLENVEILKDVRHMVLVGQNRPAAFFAYPDRPSTPEPADCRILELCTPQMDIAFTLDALAEATGAAAVEPALLPRALPELPADQATAITADAVGRVVAHHMPEGAIIASEGVTSGPPMLAQMRQGPRHDLLYNPGGAIGAALPLAVGAAIACPERKVIAPTGDGSAMYTVQSLWTMARENLDVTVLIFANRGYQILRGELANVGVTEIGRNAERMFNVESPELDWVALAQGHGVDGVRVETVGAFTEAFSDAMNRRGPCLIEIAC